MNELELLRLAVRERRQVRIEVSDCLYGCCARPPTRRSGYLQVYEGFIADVNECRLILHAIAVATLNYHVIAELRDLEAVTLIEAMSG